MADQNRAYLDDLFRDVDFLDWLERKFNRTTHVKKYFELDSFRSTIKWKAVNQESTIFENRKRAEVYTQEIACNFVIDEERRLRGEGVIRDLEEKHRNNQRRRLNKSKKSLDVQGDEHVSADIPNAELPPPRLDLRDFASSPSTPPLRPDVRDLCSALWWNV